MFKKLLTICKSGDVSSLETILESFSFDCDNSISVEEQRELTSTAAQNGHSKILSRLLISECSYDGEALLAAVSNDRYLCFKIIIINYDNFEFDSEILFDIESKIKKLPKHQGEKYYRLLVRYNKVLPKKLLRSEHWWRLFDYNYRFTDDDVCYLADLRYECIENEDRRKFFNFLDRNYQEVSKVFDAQEKAIKACEQGDLAAFKFVRSEWKLPLIEEYLQIACRKENLPLIECIVHNAFFKFKIKNLEIKNPKIIEYVIKLKKDVSIFCPYESDSESESDN